jgi:acid stress-induced BolA-like protein IbaG/YrbA
MTTIYEDIERSITDKIPDARVTVSGAGGHFEIIVRSKTAFTEKSLLQKQRLVLSSIAHLMKGDAAPVHAVDRLETLSE